MIEQNRPALTCQPEGELPQPLRISRQETRRLVQLVHAQHYQAAHPMHALEFQRHQPGELVASRGGDGPQAATVLAGRCAGRHPVELLDRPAGLLAERPPSGLEPG